MNLASLKVGQNIVAAVSNPNKFEKDKKTVLMDLFKIYQLTKVMEGESISGQSINIALQALIEQVQKQKFISWDKFGKNS